MRDQSVETADKLRGGFYTPLPISTFLVEWIQGADSVLEPSCGDGSFVKALQAISSPPGKVYGVELDSVEAKKAAEIIDSKAHWNIYNQDFLHFNPDLRVDAVVGNPPFIRYQYLSSETQLLARSIYSRNSLPFTNHTNAWGPFVIKSLMHLKPGGKLAMVIPAELLNVIHAGGVREFLEKQAQKVLVIDCGDLLFENALQRTILLLVEKKSDILQNSELAFCNITQEELLESSAEKIWNSAKFFPTPKGSDKWMVGLLSQNEILAMHEFEVNSCVRSFSEIAKVQVGIVTGANSFFLVSKETIDHFNLHKYAKPMFGRSSHVRGLSFTSEDHAQNSDLGLPCYFIDLNDVQEPIADEGLNSYLAYGESKELHLRYKTRIRNPWWKVPSVYSTNLGLLKRSHEVPKLIVNNAHALTTDTAYRITSQVDPKQLSAGWMNSFTLLACELYGRSYGGGVLELVPSEIRRLPVAIHDSLARTFDGLDLMVRMGASPADILEQQNKYVAKALKIDPELFELAEQARIRLFQRRTNN